MADLLRLATAGSVDDGKSTLVGRLLYDTKSVLADQLEAVERASVDRGLSTPDLSLLVDGLRAERDQGITIDVAYRYFATPRRTFVLADTPGHVQYTRNTVTGASTAQLAILLVDARNGVVEQTRRHAAVLALLGVPYAAVLGVAIEAASWSVARTPRLLPILAETGVVEERVPRQRSGAGRPWLTTHPSARPFDRAPVRRCADAHPWRRLGTLPPGGHATYQP